MNRSCLSIFIGVGLIFLAHTVSAQTPAVKSKAPLNNAAGGEKSEARAEADREAKERRTKARLLLISLASEAHSFRNQTLRARSMARIADALWAVDAEQGRALFRKAWEAAETGDRESKEPLPLGQGPLNLRREVLTLAARRDRLLAEEFLQKLKIDQQETETKAEPSEDALWKLQETSEKRLNLAKELLSTGDIKRALEFADPVLNSITISTVEFLTQLREKDAAAADQRYAAMLASTDGNLLADANTISLLSSYIFTPHTYVIFGPDGGADSYAMRSHFPPAGVDPQLRLAFFRTASSVLLRPQPPPPQQDQSTAGIAGKYMVTKRLIPLFEQYAPKEITEALRSQLAILNSLVSNDVRQSENAWVQKGLSPEKALTDREQPLLEQIERAKTSDERDELYFKLALLALSKDDLKARDYVSKIDEGGFRKRAQAWVDWSLAIRAIEKKKSETALDLSRSGELTHIQRVWLLTRTAQLLAKTDRDKALSLLDDATFEARRIESTDLDRPRAFLAIANALRLFDPSRAWDTILDTVKAANSTEGFTGEDGVLTLTVNSKTQILKKTEAVPDFNIEGIFGKLATSDYDRAVLLARGFQSEAPRANATIAIARAVLDEKAVARTKDRE